jgi:tetratricopeptide (TPR) repeat protein
VTTKGPQRWRNPCPQSALLESGWLLLAILLPLWVVLWVRQPFELPKVALVRTMAGLLLATALCLSWRSNSLRFSHFSLRHSPLFWPITALISVLIVATATAVHPQLSLWGSYERGQGVLTQLAYLWLFLLVATQMQTLQQARRLFLALVWPGLFLAAMGVIQLLAATLNINLGWQLLPLVTDARSPVYATLGRSNFLGAYLAILLPLTLALLVTSRQRRSQMALSALLLAQLGVLGMTLARSAWPAALVGLALFVLLWRGARLTGRWRYITWAGLGMVALSGPLAVLWLGRLEQGSSAARLTIWQSTLELIRQRPFLGYGPDSLFLVFPRVFPPELVYYQGRQFFVDRAHNWLLDWAVTTGLLGLLALLSVLVAFIFIAQRAWREAATAERRALLAGAVAAVGANLTNNLVSFDVTATAATTWLLMGVVVALDRRAPEIVTIPTRPRPFWQQAVISLLALAVALGGLVANGRILLADSAAYRANQYSLIGQWQLAVSAGERATAYWPLEPVYYHDLARHQWQQARQSDVPWPWLQQAELSLLTARDLRPQDVAVWGELAEFYAAAVWQFGTDTRPFAHQAYRQAAALAPNHATVYVAWGGLYLEEGDREQAAFLLRQAVRLDASHGLAYLLLGEAELGQGRIEAAIGAYGEAVRLQPESSIAHTELARSYWLAGQPEAARSSLARALALEPNNSAALTLAHQLSEP